MNPKNTFVNFTVEKVNQDGSVKFRFTEKKIDRMGEVVLPDGGRLENFKSNPIILFNHGYSTQRNIPVGRAIPETVRQSAQSITGEVLFDDDGSDPFATMISGKVKKGFLNTGSIGFMPIEISDEPVLPKQKGVTHKIWELLEYSIAPIPALPSSLALREFGEIREAIQKEFGSADEMDSIIDKYFQLDLESDQKDELASLIRNFQDQLTLIHNRVAKIEIRVSPPPSTPGIPPTEADNGGSQETEESRTEGLLKSITEFNKQVKDAQQILLDLTYSP